MAFEAQKRFLKDGCEEGAEMTREEVAKNVAESIRCVSEYVAEHADDYAQGMEDGQGMEIKMVFELDALPSVVVERSVLPVKFINAIHDGRCGIWTRFSKNNPAVK